MNFTSDPRTTGAQLLLFVFALSSLFSFSSGARHSVPFERGDRYWSGRPQPIGIDFSEIGVVGVYAQGDENFTTLGSVFSDRGLKRQYPYAQYIYQLYSKENEYEGAFLFSEDLESEPWRIESLSPASFWAVNLRETVCRKLSPILTGWRLFEEFCFPEEIDLPQKPLSKCGHLRSKLQKSLLQRIIPRRFRRPQPPQGLPPLTRSNFILSIFELLEELKEISAKEHNITITSATISQPPWAWNEVNSLFDEACLLADIEVLEQPHNRIDISAKTVWDEEEKAFRGTESVSQEGLGLMHMLLPLSVNLLNVWGSENHTCNVETGEMHWVSDIGTTKIVSAVNTARLQLRYGTGLAQDVDFANRSTAVNLTDSTGYSRALNMTGQNVLDAEKEYFDKVGRLIKSHLLHERAAVDYYMNNPLCKRTEIFDGDEWITSIFDCVRDAPPPEGFDSWYRPVDDVIILDDNWDAPLLRQTAESVIGRNQTEQMDGVCIAPMVIPARGAALRAREWGVYYEGWKEEMDYYDRMARGDYYYGAHGDDCQDDEEP